MRNSRGKALPPIILASCSTRRSDLLAMCRIPHRVAASGAREDKFGARPSEVVIKNALRKARAIAARLTCGIVIGADTVVFLDNTIIGKLRSKEKVKEMLRRLSRKISYVYTGLTVIDVPSGACAYDYAVTKIKMKKIPEEALESWLSHIGPYDRAGGFSIEGPGSILFPHIEGCYFNILGLPMSMLYDLFSDIGYNLLDFMEEGSPRRGRPATVEFREGQSPKGTPCRCYSQGGMIHGGSKKG